MNEQTRNELSAKLEELDKRSQEAWEQYQQAEKELNDAAAKLGIVADPLENLRVVKKQKQATWHSLYTAADGIRALFALEGK